MFARVSSHVKEGIHQGHLEAVVKNLFSNEDNIVFNARKEGKLNNPITGRALEIDIYIPKKNICFEFQDPYHYISTWDSNVPLSSIQQNDSTKQELIHSRGDTFISVPCWWDGREESLIGSIQFSRPDLFQERKKFEPIPENPPLDFFQFKGIPGVQELMLASFPQNFNDIDLSVENPWWVGEKYDGLRCCWHPKLKTVYGRSGLELDVPSTFKSRFYDVLLDLEFWCGRGMFGHASRVLNQNESSLDWSTTRMIAFDIAGMKTSTLPFEERYHFILSIISITHPFLILAFRLLCTSSQLLVNLSNFIINNNGEGLIMRKPKSFYEHGRSSSLLKYKAARGDKEALVLEDQGNNKYLLSTPDGVNFTVENNDKNNKIKKGDIVTFSYESYSRREIPLGPKITRVRTDVTWEQVLETNRSDNARLSGSTVKLFNYAPKPVRYWTAEKGKNMRNFFEKIAKKNNFNPLIPSHWYSYTAADIIEMGGEKILRNFKGSLVRALKELFNEVQFDGSKFTNVPLKYWSDPRNRRKLLEKFAHEKGFDPLVAENWYPIYLSELEAFKGGKTVVASYNGNLVDTLIHLFPEVKFTEKHFSSLPKNFWANRNNRKQFFIDYAKEKNFDLSNPENWYNVTKLMMCNETSVKGGYSVFHYYKSIANALKDLFQDMDLDMTRFKPIISRKNEITTWRALAERLVRENKLDPLSPSTWYHPPPSIFAGLKAICDNKFGGDFAAAIMEIFPELSLDSDQIPHLDQYHHYKTRFKFFVKFAEKNNFDPLTPANWYKYSENDIIGHPDGSRVLKYYDNSLSRALTNLFPSIGLNPFEFANNLHLKNRRLFFEKYASTNNFDPLQANNWSLVSAQEILSIKGGRFLRDYYHGNLSKAIRHLFPEMKLDATSI